MGRATKDKKSYLGMPVGKCAHIQDHEFADKYPLVDDRSDSGELPFEGAGPPRMMYKALVSCQLRSDDVFGDPFNKDSKPSSLVTYELPPCARDYWEHDRAWAEAFRECFLRLAGRIANGLGPRPNCTGEEMAIHIAMSRIREEVDDMGEDWAFHEQMESLPECPEHDDDYEMFLEYATEDADVMMLFHYGADDIKGVLGDAGPLHPKEWFVAFRDERMGDHLEGWEEGEADKDDAANVELTEDQVRERLEKVERRRSELDEEKKKESECKRHRQEGPQEDSTEENKGKKIVYLQRPHEDSVDENKVTKMVHFLASGKVRYGDDLFVPSRIFAQYFNSHCVENSLGRIDIEEFSKSLVNRGDTTYLQDSEWHGILNLDSVTQQAGREIEVWLDPSVTYRGREYKDQWVIHGLDMG